MKTHTLNKAASVRDFIGWDIVNWSSALKFWEEHSSQELSHCSALEIGCGNSAGLTLWLSQQGAKVIASDYNEQNIELAREKHRKFGSSTAIEYERIDATNIPYCEQFDIIMFKSVLGGVGAGSNEELQKELQGKAIKEMYRALKPGGELFFAENLVSSPIHKYFRSKFMKRQKHWRYDSSEELNEFLSVFSHVDSKITGFLGCLGRNEVQRRVLGVIDKYCMDFLIPERWKYIMIGVAKK